MRRAWWRWSDTSTRSASTPPPWRRASGRSRWSTWSFADSRSTTWSGCSTNGRCARASTGARSGGSCGSWVSSRATLAPGRLPIAGSGTARSSGIRSGGAASVTSRCRTDCGITWATPRSRSPRPTRPTTGDKTLPRRRPRAGRGGIKSVNGTSTSFARRCGWRTTCTSPGARGRSGRRSSLVSRKPGGCGTWRCDRSPWRSAARPRACRRS